jgi:hypothetical protein
MSRTSDRLRKNRVTSFVAPESEDAENRRAWVDVTDAMDAPAAATDGFKLRSSRHVHAVITVVDGTVDYKLWKYYEMADVWVEDDDVGTVSLAIGTHAGLFEVWGCDRVYVQFLNFAGATVNGWIGGNSL